MSISTVAGMVTIYHSEKTVLSNVSSYVNQVGKLYVIDNSETPDLELLRELQAISPSVVCLPGRGNEGLAVALNRAAQQAISDGFTHLLTMDDDSSLPAGAVELLLATINAADNIGMVAGGIVDPNSKKAKRPPKRPDIRQELTLITAGSILKLEAYQKAGPFQDELFIDWVDLEYSFRLSRHGYILLTNPQIRVFHRLGIKKKTYLLGFIPYRWRSHNPIRLYYKFRNGTYILNRDADIIPERYKRRFYKELRSNIFKIILAETDKKRFYSLIRRALRDGKAGHLGKLVE